MSPHQGHPLLGFTAPPHAICRLCPAHVSCLCPMHSSAACHVASIPSTPPVTSWLPDSQASTACCHRLPAALPWALRPLPLLCPFDPPRLPFLLPSISVSPLQTPLRGPGLAAPTLPMSPTHSHGPTAASEPFAAPPPSCLEVQLPSGSRDLNGLHLSSLIWSRLDSWALVLLASRPPGTGNSLLPHPSPNHHQVSLLLFSHPVVSNSFQPHGPQHTRLPCPSLFPGVCTNSCPLNQ